MAKFVVASLRESLFTIDKGTFTVPNPESLLHIFKMARLAKRPSPDDDGASDTSTLTRRPPNRRSNNPGSLSPSPAASFSSDKENQSESAQRGRDSNGKTRTMGPPKLPTPGSAESTTHSNKRRRLGDRDAPSASQALLRQQLSKVEDLQYYDPDQPMDERRIYRRKMRKLTRELNGRSLVYSFTMRSLT